MPIAPSALCLSSKLSRASLVLAAKAARTCASCTRRYARVRRGSRLASHRACLCAHLHARAGSLREVAGVEILK
eukprot:5495929-Pleurochrysis_carterae.AAC.3